jgi:hypothetical protein
LCAHTSFMRGLCVLLCLVPPAGALEELYADGNPHREELASTCCPAQALPPDHLLVDAPFLARQLDTFVAMKIRRHLGQPVPVFSFRQPSRLSHLALPFDLALVDDQMDPRGIVEVPSSPAVAADSWFPDYAWSHYIVCTASSGIPPVHLGWRFTRKPGATGRGPASFVALIVRAVADEEPLHARSTMSATATAVAVAVDGPAEVASAEAEDPVAFEPAPPLKVGTEAPAWMVTMVAALTSRVHQRTSVLR